MTTREFLTKVRERNVRLTDWQLRGMVKRGTVPTPRLNSSLQWDWTEAEIDAVVNAAKPAEVAVAS